MRVVVRHTPCFYQVSLYKCIHCVYIYTRYIYNMSSVTLVLVLVVMLHSFITSWLGWATCSPWASVEPFFWWPARERENHWFITSQLSKTRALVMTCLHPNISYTSPITTYKPAQFLKNWGFESQNLGYVQIGARIALGKACQFEHTPNFGSPGFCGMCGRSGFWMLDNM